MSRAKKRFHLIFIALVLWGDANGFSVWNKGIIGDWETGHFNASWNQNVHLATPVQPFELLSRKVAHGNVGKGGGKSNSSVLESVVKTAQQDSSFVQPSGDHDKLVLNKDWPVKGHDEPGFQIPSFFQSAATSSQASGSWTSLSQSNMAQVPAKYLPSAFLTQSSGVSTLYQGPTSNDQTTPYSSQTVTAITKSQTQASYHPSTSTPVLIGQSAVHRVPSLGGFTLYPGRTSGWYTILGGQMMPPHSQVSAFPSQLLYQPSTTKQAMAGQPHSAPPAPSLPASTPSSSQPSTTWVMADQFHSTSPAPTLVASKLNQVLASSSNLTVKDQIIQFSSQSVITTNQINASQSPSHSSNMAVLTGQSDIVQVQPLGGFAFYPGQNSGWYTIFEGRHIPSSSQVSGFQSQSLYQPSTTKPVMAGQFHSTSPALSLAVSSFEQGEAPSKNILQDRSTLSSESVGTTSSPTQSSYKPSTPVLPGQSGIALAQSLREGAFYPGQNSGWYTILQGWKIPSSFRVPGFQSQSLYQPSTAPQALEGQSHSISPAPSLDASTSDQGLSSSSNQSLQDQIIASSSQFVVTKNQSTESQTQSSYQSSTTTLVLAGQSVIAPALSSSPLQSLEASASYPGQTSGWNNILQGQKIPSSSQVCGFQTQSGHQPSTTTQVSTSQSASTAPGQASGTSTLYQGLAYSSNLTLQDQSIPSSSQTVFTENQISESQTQSSNQPSTTTQVVAGQSASRLSSMGASTLYQGQASSRYISHDQSILSSSKSVTPNSISGFQSQTSYWPNTEQIGLQKPMFTSQAQGSYGTESSHHAKWHSIFPGQTISSFSRFSASVIQSYQPSTTKPVLAGQFASPLPSIGASTLYQGQASSRYNISQDQSIQSSSQLATSQKFGSQNLSLYLLSPTNVLTGQSATAQDQSLGGSVPYPSQMFGGYTLLKRGRKMGSSRVSVWIPDPAI